MMNHSLILDEKEQKTRNHWLRATAIRMILLPIIGFLLSLFFSFRNSILQLDSVALVVTLFGFIVVMAFGVMWFFIMRRCSYKKPGTKFLTFLIVIGFIGLIYFPFLIFKNLNLSAILILDFSVNVYWLYLSVKMRKINKKIQSKLNAPDKLCCE